MEKLITTQEKKARQRSLKRRFVAVAASVLIIFGITQPQIIATGREWMVYWFAGHTSFQFAEDTDINWVPRYEFGYVPEGFVKKTDDYDFGGYIHYENEQGNRIILNYGGIDDGLNVDNSYKDFLILTGNNGEKIYYLRAQKAGDDSSMIWISKDGTTKFDLISDLPEEELLKLQENIRISKNELKSYIRKRKFSKNW